MDLNNNSPSARCNLLNHMISSKWRCNKHIKQIKLNRLLCIHQIMRLRRLNIHILILRATVITKNLIILRTKTDNIENNNHKRDDYIDVSFFLGKKTK